VQNAAAFLEAAERGLAHAEATASASNAFMKTIIYFDYDRTGWDYPIIPI